MNTETQLRTILSLIKRNNSNLEEETRTHLKKTLFNLNSLYVKQCTNLQKITKNHWSIGDTALGKEVSACIAGDGHTHERLAKQKSRELSKTTTEQENLSHFNCGELEKNNNAVGLPYVGSGKFFIRKSLIAGANLGLFAKKDLYDGISNLKDKSGKWKTFCEYIPGKTTSQNNRYIISVEDKKRKSQ